MGCQSFIAPSDTTVDGIILHGHTSWNSGSARIFLKSSSCSGSTLGTSGDINANSADMDFIFGSPISITSGTTYFIVFDRNDTGAKYIQRDTTNPYAGGQAWEWNGSSYVSDSGSDMRFEVYNNAPTSPTVSITFPTSTSTPISEFSEWEIHYVIPSGESSTSTDFYSKQVYVGSSSSTISTLAGATSFFSPSSPNDLSITKPFGMLGGTGTWYAQAYLIYWESIYDEVPDISATSTVISFVLNGQESVGGSYTTPTSTATSTEWVMTCDPDDPFFERSICNVMKFLFYPSGGIMNNFQSLYTDIQNKPPFGYYSKIKLVLEGISTSTTSTYTFADISGSLSNTLFNPLRTGISWLLYLMFGFWIFHRARHIEF